jgi:orotidine-5'-phosphate decarboxylase
MDQLLVALDVDTLAEAVDLTRRLRGLAGGFKVGSRLFSSHGPSVVDTLVSNGERVFLDLKFYDIPSTVAGAVTAATRLGVWMVNVHTGGGTAMMRAARAAADDEAARLGRPAPLLIGVTVLTSLNAQALGEVGVPGSLEHQVTRLAGLARSAGLDGVVASPREIPLIQRECGQKFLIVTPGIRGTKDAKGDQSRTMSAPEALAAGASYLVVGRPILSAADPHAAAEDIVASCRSAMPR